jgi:hypothetical protein
MLGELPTPTFAAFCAAGAGVFWVMSVGAAVRPGWAKLGRGVGSVIVTVPMFCAGAGVVAGAGGGFAGAFCAFATALIADVAIKVVTIRRTLTALTPCQTNSTNASVSTDFSAQRHFDVGSLSRCDPRELHA